MPSGLDTGCPEDELSVLHRREGRVMDGEDRTKNKQVVQQFWDALAARDWDGMKALLTDDAHYTDIGVPGPGGYGPDGVIARLKLGIEPLEGYDHLPGTNMIAEGDLVMTEHTERWTFGTGEVIDHSFVSDITDNAPAWWLESLATAAADVADGG
jgi:hypothetical protein